MYYCPHCTAAMALDETPGGELAYECTNLRCRFTAHAATAAVSLLSYHVGQRVALRGELATVAQVEADGYLWLRRDGHTTSEGAGPRSVVALAAV